MAPRTAYQVSIDSTPAAKIAAPPYADFYPVRLCDGSRLMLPIQPLPGGEQGIALLMSNQTPFSVERHVASLLSRLAREFEPEVIAGIPTLGLDYARLAAQALGFEHYVALGNSRKFWYEDRFSVPVISVTSPGVTKRLYLDPALVGRVEGKRVLVIDDVINTGGSAAAAIELLSRAGAHVVGLAVALIEGDEWKRPLSLLAADWPQRVKGIGCIPIFRRDVDGWHPLP